MHLSFANTALFEINKEADVNVVEIGQWKSRVITIDNVLDILIEWCSGHPLERSRSFYQGGSSG